MARNATAYLVDKIEPHHGPGAMRVVYGPYDNTVAGFDHNCPCGCGSQSYMGINREVNARACWDVVKGSFDDLPNLTLSPSIGIGLSPKGFHWHGYLENGVFVER